MVQILSLNCSTLDPYLIMLSVKQGLNPCLQDYLWALKPRYHNTSWTKIDEWMPKRNNWIRKVSHWSSKKNRGRIWKQCTCCYTHRSGTGLQNTNRIKISCIDIELYKGSVGPSYIVIDGRVYRTSCQWGLEHTDCIPSKGVKPLPASKRGGWVWY